MKKQLFFIIITIIPLAIILNFFYSYLVISNPQNKLREITKNIYLKDNKLKKDFDLSKDAYLIKIKHLIRKEQQKEIFVNGFKITTGILKISKRGIIETTYIYLPRGIIKEGKNSIEITFSQGSPRDATIILSNYRRNLENNIFILFSDSVYVSRDGVSLKTIILTVVIIFLLVCEIIYFLSNRIFYLSPYRLYLFQIYSTFPFLVFLYSLWAYSILNQLYRVAITPEYFWKFGIISLFIVNGAIIVRKILQTYRLIKKNIDYIRNKELLIVNPRVMRFTIKAAIWFRAKKFSDKCILFFMVLIIMCAFLLILNLGLGAEQFAKIAYLTLVISVAIEFMKLLKEA